jgi:RimJ/RimL family protein N-acetyltransferase
MELESKRLRFRKFHEDDAEVVFRWANNPENIKYTRFDGNKQIEDTQAFITECIILAEADICLDFEYIVELKDTGSIIGSVQIICLNEFEASLGYLFLPEYWHKGYGTESVKTLIDFGFDKLKLHRILTKCDAENHASYHVMQKSGMRLEGHFIKNRCGNVVLNYEWRDELLYAILHEEWERLKE